MSGEANDAVSAHTLVKMSDASRLLKLLETHAQRSCTGSKETLTLSSWSSSKRRLSAKVAKNMCFNSSEIIRSEERNAERSDENR